MMLEKIILGLVFLAPWAILIVNSKAFSGKRKVISWVASVAAVYAIFLVGVYVVDVRLERELYAFDLNADGVFSGKEINPAQEAAMARLANDTGRAMAPITGAIFSCLYVAIVFLLWFLVSWCWSAIRARRT